MDRTEHILINLMEECGEVAQRASKAARFSLGEIQPGQPYTNAERIMHEWADLNGMMEKCIEEGLVKWPDDFAQRVMEKKQRFEKFLGRSKEHGALLDEQPHTSSTEKEKL